MGWGQNIVMLVICINIFLTVTDSAAVQYMGQGTSIVTNTSLADTFYKSSTITNDSIQYNINGNSSVASAIPQNPVSPSVQSGGTSVFNWIDPLSSVWSALKLLFNVLFGIYYMFYLLPGFPLLLAFIISAPLSVAYTIALVKLVRTGEF